MSIAKGIEYTEKFTTAATPHATTVGQTTQATGSAFLVFYIGGGGAGTIGTPTDNKGNTYTAGAAQVTAASAAVCRWWYVENGAGGAGHTWSVTTTTGEVGSIFVLEIKGGATSGILDQAPAGVSDLTSPYTSNTTGTTSQANEMIVAMVATDSVSGTEVITWGGGFTQSTAVGDANFATGGLGTQISSATGTFTSSITSSGAGTTGAVSFVASFKELAGAASASPTGNAGTGSAGTVTQTHTGSVTLTGAAGTGSPGTVVATMGVLITGVGATGSPGTVTVQGGAISANVTGNAGTGAAGTVTASTSAGVSANPTGVAGTGAAAALGPILLEVTIQTVNGTGAAGMVTETHTSNISPTGVTATGSPGALALASGTQVSLAGVAGTGAANWMSVSSSSSMWTGLFAALGTGGAGAVTTVAVNAPTQSIPSAGVIGSAGRVLTTPALQNIYNGVSGAGSSGPGVSRPQPRQGVSYSGVNM